MKTRWRELDDDDWWDTPEAELLVERSQEVEAAVLKYFGLPVGGDSDHDDSVIGAVVGLYREHPEAWTSLSTKELAGVIYMRLVFTD